MGVGDVVLRNDIQYERYDLVSPRELAARLRSGARPRRRRTAFGDADRVAARRDPHEDETTLAAPADEAPPAPVVVYPVDGPDSDRARPSRRTRR